MQYFKKKKKKPTVNSLHNVWDAFLGVKLRCASGNGLCLPRGDTAPLANPGSPSPLQRFVSINAVMFYVVRTQGMISTAPQLLLVVSLLEMWPKPSQRDPSELGGRSAWLVGTAGGSAPAGKSPPGKSAGNRIRWCIQGESYAATDSLV